MERIAIIDLGSNSARLIVMHIYENGAYNLVYHQKETVRLSEGTADTCLLQPEAMKRAIDTLKIFAHMIEILEVNKTLAVATAAVRNAVNGADFVHQVETETGISFRVISGETEAMLGYSGVINTIDITDALLFDLGGGSTELTLIKNRKAEKAISLPFGAVNLTERFGLQNKVSDAQLNEAHTFIMHQLEQVSWLKNLSVPLIGTGGTARNIAKMDQKRKNYPISKVHNYRLGWLSFDDLWREISKATLAQRRKIPGLSSERADIIIGGLSIVKRLFDITQSGQLIISGCGVREGLFFQYYLARSGQSEVISDILTHSASNMLLFYKGSTAHAHHVARLAGDLFDGWQEILALTPCDKRLLEVAALLHDIGITVNYYDHARHSAYMVENARLFGLTHREQMMAAVIAGWHNGPANKFLRNKMYSEFLDERDWQTARRLALLLAMAESLDAAQIGVIEKVIADTVGDKARLSMFASEPALLELHAVEKFEKWFRKETKFKLLIEHSF